MRTRNTIAIILLSGVGLFGINSCGKKTDPVTTPQPTKSSAKSITAFSFNGLSPAVTATVDANNKTITATVPISADLTKLVPTITIPSTASVSPGTGVAQDFSKPVNYVVTAEDGSTQTYVVTVTVANAVPLAIDCKNVPATLEDRGTGVDYTVGCQIVVPNNVIFTIKPGVTIQFTSASAGMVVQDLSTVGSNNGALNMLGTADKPIALMGATATQGAWAGVQIFGVNVNNQWAYVTLRDAGAGQYNSGLFIDNANRRAMQLSIENCNFINNAGYGIWDYDNGYSYNVSIFSSFKANTFSGNGKSAMKVKIGNAGSLDAASAYNNNGQNYIEVTGNNLALANNITLQNLNVPYQIQNIIWLNQKVTINPGTTIQFGKDAGLMIRYNDNSGSLIANGTAAAPIRFVGATANIKGFWFGIELDNADPQISLNYCVIDGAGSIPSGTGCASPTKTAVNFGGRCGAGTLYGTGTLTNSTVTNSGGYAVSYRPGRNVVLTNNTYSGNTLTDINIYSN